MQAFIAIIKAITIIMPLVAELIQSIEAAMPASGQGKAKLEMLRGMLAQVYTTTNGATVAFEAIWPMLQPMIAGIVAMYNSAGTFKKPV